MFPLRTLAALVLAAPLAAISQGYPAKSIRLIVPFAAGGGTDAVARLVAQKMSEGLGQAVVVENRAGVSGIMGTEVATRSAPDGYTILQAVEALVINPFIYKKLPYETPRDFTPISLTTRDPAAVAVHASLPVTSVGEFIAYAKNYPGKLNIATANRMSAELLKYASGIDAQIVMYKGAAAAANDALGGQVQVLVTSLAAIMPHARSERIRLIAITDSVRFKALPDVPTVGETIAGFEGAGWTALVGPAGLPSPIVARLNSEVVKAVKLAEIQSKFEAAGTIAAGSTPEELAAWIRNGLEKWRKVTLAAGIQPE